MSEAGLSAGKPAQTAITKSAWYALLVVGLANTHNLLDRQILAILAPDIQRDLNIGDAEIGMLYGTMFALFYALFSLPAGRLADGWLRTRLLSVSIFFWSAATALGGLAGSFSTLLLSRLGVGIGEAATQPAGTSLVYDYWPKANRGFAIAFVAACATIGMGGALALGGVMTQWWNTAFPAGTAPLGIRGWQFALFVAAAPGVILGAMPLFLPEPKRGQMDGIDTPHDPQPFRASFAVLGSILPGVHWLIMLARRVKPAVIWRNLAMLAVIAGLMWLLVLLSDAVSPRPAITIGHLTINPHVLQWTAIGIGLFAIVNLLQGMGSSDPQALRVILRSPTLMLCIASVTLQSIINYGLLAFSPTFAIRFYGLSLQETAIMFGIIMSVFGFVGPLIWGPTADYFHRLFPGKGRPLVALVTMAASPLLAVWLYKAPTSTDFFWRLVPHTLAITGWLPSLYAVIYEQVLPRMRGLTASLLLLVMTIVGMGVGPYAVGLISEASGNLQFALVIINIAAVPMLIINIVIMMRAGRDEAALLERAAG